MLGVVVVSDVQIFREGLAMALGSSGAFEVSQSAARPAEVLRVIRRRKPRVALVDPGAGAGLKVMTEIARDAPQVAQIALALGGDMQQILACAEAGAAGFVPHNASLRDLARAIHNADAGTLQCAPDVAHDLFCHVGRLCANGTPQKTDGLTPRETEILDLIEQGLPNKVIATELGIGVSTVKNHVHSLLAKMGVRRRGEAAARYRRRAP